MRVKLSKSSKVLETCDVLSSCRLEYTYIGIR